MTLEVLDEFGELLGWLPVPTICDWNWPRPMRPPPSLRFLVGRWRPSILMPYLGDDLTLANYLANVEPQSVGRVIELPIVEWASPGAQPRLVLFAGALGDVRNVEGFRPYR